MESTLKEIYFKLTRYCAYRERAVSEVEEKLRSLEIGEDLALEVMRKLIAENYVNESRFAEQYASGKLRNNGWGKVKIKQGLKQKSVGISHIDRALDSLDKDEYMRVMYRCFLSKLKIVKAKSIFEKRSKVAKYLIAKGFETSLVWDLIKTEMLD